MTVEEKEIANSTPSAPPPTITMPAVTDEAVDFVKNMNGSNKVPTLVLVIVFMR